VIEIDEHSQMTPVVRVFYNRKQRQAVPMRLVNLAQPGNQDRIVRALDPVAEKVDLKPLL
jgi:hypothetical protein